MFRGRRKAPTVQSLKACSVRIYSGLIDKDKKHFQEMSQPFQECRQLFQEAIVQYFIQLAVVPTLYGTTLQPHGCVPARSTPFYVRTISSVWGHFGCFTRSAFRRTPSRCFLGVLSVVARCFEARYKRGKREGNLKKSTFLQFGSSLVVPWFFLGFSLVFDLRGTREEPQRKILTKSLFANTSYIRRSCLLECDSEVMDKENKCSANLLSIQFIHKGMSRRSSRYRHGLSTYTHPTIGQRGR